jgi:hypothetical protein
MTSHAVLADPAEENWSVVDALRGLAALCCSITRTLFPSVYAQLAADYSVVNRPADNTGTASALAAFEAHAWSATVLVDELDARGLQGSADCLIVSSS